MKTTTSGNNPAIKRHCHGNDETHEIMIREVLPTDLYTASELRLKLSRYRQRRVPERTLRWWMRQIGMVPTSEGFYTKDDLWILINLIGHLSRKGTIKQFIKQLQKQQEIKENAN